MNQTIETTGMQTNFPGRLGDPATTLLTDPRLDPRIAAAMTMAAALAPGVTSVGPDATYEQSLAYCLAFEQANAAFHPQLLAALPPAPTVHSSTTVIQGVDNNPINLYIHKPVDQQGPLPCVVHLHGGGMVLMTAEDPGFIGLRNDLAASGMVVIGVEFRNGGGRLGNHPFPAGLNDCASAVKWAYTNKDQLGISAIVVAGESGGGNLSLATTLKAQAENWLDQINGVYAMCPYISGTYAAPPAELVSQVENAGYMLEADMMGALVKVYDPNNDHADNPLAWPWRSAPATLAGLPPHFISVNELDPLRDEGLAYYRKLLAAGVSAVARTVHGTPHAGDVSLPGVVPDIYQETLRSINGFATALAATRA